ncbi:UDP-N-acetylmuramate dehydrogenase [bacterium SCSIO 12643]|nr:UDP-N-acetylmuramate dehydrogenase [bacterium SCSIO 12643]
MQVQKNISLKPYNTFGIDVNSSLFLEWSSIADVQEYTQNESLKSHDRLILGGGSNMLLTKDFDGLAIRNHILGKEVISENEDQVIVKIGGGEVWHDIVLWTISQGWNGMENMSLIPGSVGAAPIQNIGAYGKELKDLFVELEAVNLSNGEIRNFDLNACDFGYRNSVFKNELKGQYIITSVTLRLSKKSEFNISYGTIQQELDKMGIEELTAKSISDAVIAIRQSKLPDPKELGNSGSFFKNPIIPESLYEEVKFEYPGLPSYPAGEEMVKVPAGWLIDQAGWKGRRVGNCGVHSKQALVLVNYGGATGQEIFQLSEEIIADVIQKYGIELEREVNVI